jgi:hypothetical protein
MRVSNRTEHEVVVLSLAPAAVGETRYASIIPEVL